MADDILYAPPENKDVGAILEEGDGVFIFGPVEEGGLVFTVQEAIDMSKGILSKLAPEALA